MSTYLSAFLTIALLHFLAVVTPGPDFAMVTKNAIVYSRKSAVYTALGIALGLCVHITYCILGLAIVIAHSLLLFSIIKYCGAAYLIYVGLKSLTAKSVQLQHYHHQDKNDLTSTQALRQGIFCNVLNPKATLFFLGLFTLVVKPQTPIMIQLAYGTEMMLMTFLWFSLVANFMTHDTIKSRIQKVQHRISHVMGGFFIFFGVKLMMLQR